MKTAQSEGRPRLVRVTRVALVVLAATVAMPVGASAEVSALDTLPGFTFGAAGDFGYSANAQATFSTAGGEALDFFLALGDTTYNETSEATWCNAFRAQVPHVLVQAGNHDTGENTGAWLSTLLTACPYDLNETLNGRYGREWYFDYPGTAPLARFILTGCGTNFVTDGESVWACAAGDPHYQFVANAIDSARASGVHWIIVGIHKNCITAGAKVCEIGTAFFDMLLEKRVDLILQGHDHVYGRSKQLTCATPGSYRSECVADDGSDGGYAKGNGSVVMIQGTGGKGPYAWNASDAELAYFAKGYSGTYGFSKFTVNFTRVTVSFVRSAGNNNSDSFVIETPPLVLPARPQPFLPGFDGAAGVLAVAAAAVALVRGRRPAR